MPFLQRNPSELITTNGAAERRMSTVVLSIGHALVMAKLERPPSCSNANVPHKMSWARNPWGWPFGADVCLLNVQEPKPARRHCLPRRYQAQPLLMLPPRLESESPRCASFWRHISTSGSLRPGGKVIHCVVEAPTYLRAFTRPLTSFGGLPRTAC